MKFCPYCGKQLDGNHSFCPYCGKQLGEQSNYSNNTEPFDPDDYYGILGVSHSATEEEIKTAFRNIAKKCHPDVNGGNEALTDKFRKAAEAYEVLNNRDRRAAYDYYCADNDPMTGVPSSFYEEYMSGVQEEAARTEAYIHSLFEQLKDSRKDAITSFFIGLACIAGGLILTFGSMALAAHFGGHYVVTIGLLICGAIGAIRSFFHAIVLSVDIARFKKTFWDSL